MAAGEIIVNFSPVHVLTPFVFLGLLFGRLNGAQHSHYLTLNALWVLGEKHL
jgi:hypothetical protein